MRLLGVRKQALARIAVAVMCVFAVEALTAAGTELVRITAPANGQQVSGRIRVEAQTSVNDPAYLIFCVDGKRPHSTNAMPYAYEIDTSKLGDGSHVLAVEVYGRAGLAGESAPVTITVANSITLPAPAAVVQQATAADPKAGTEAKVAIVDQVAAAPRQGPTLPVPASAALAADIPSPSSAAHAATPLIIVLDERELSFDVAPRISDGRTHVALRALVEQSGGTVYWLAAARQAIARRAGSELRVTIGASQAQLDGRMIELGDVATLVKGRTIVTLRTACESLGLKTAWSSDARTVRLCSADTPMRVGMAIAR